MTSQSEADDGSSILERVAEQRLRLLLVANALAQSLDPHAVSDRILQAAGAVLGAPLGWVAVATGDGAAVEILHALGYDETVLRSWTRVPLDSPVPMTEVIRTGIPIYHASAAERHAAYPMLERSAAPRTETEGSAVVPLVFEGRAFGALSVAFREPRVLDTDERWFLESLAAQASAGLERARLFEAVRDHDERLRFTLEATGTGTWEWDLDTGILSWSAIEYELHGVDPSGPPPDFAAWLAMLHPEDRGDVLAVIEADMQEGRRYDVEVRVVRPDGSVRWIHSSGRLMVVPGSRAGRMVGTTRDISDRKRAEAERNRVLEAEREAARLRDAFVGVVSHELRTPITTIFGGTRVLARRWREMEPAARDDLLGDVAEEADRLYRLVEDLLVLTKVERGTLDIGDEPVHVGKVLERVVATERQRWPGVTFEVRMPTDLPSVAGEDAYLEHILRNLLANAAKYGGVGSTVTVAAGPDDGQVVLCVLDEGPGIDEAESDRLFDLFYRSPATASTVQGAGIGLFVCRQLVEALGGRIGAGQRPEGGASFWLRLPRSEDDGA
ncbi:MAG: ATP-binding protein [Chloroflexota bacterium]